MTSESRPLVSIGITCYNYGRYLKESIESALNQTYKPIEIIVVNDGSNDNSQEVASRYPVKLINQPNMGTAASSNKCILLSNGEYCLLLNADDKLHPYYVEKTLKVLLAHPEIAFVYTHMTLFGAEQRIRIVPEYNPAKLKKNNYINCSALMKKSAFMQTKGFDQTLAFWEDWDIWLSFAEKGLYGKLFPEPLLFWRRHFKESRSIVSSEIKKQTYLHIMKKHRRLFRHLTISVDIRILILKEKLMPLGTFQRKLYSWVINRLRGIIT